jgi:hypothetical protein
MLLNKYNYNPYNHPIFTQSIVFPPLFPCPHFHNTITRNDLQKSTRQKSVKNRKNRPKNVKIRKKSAQNCKKRDQKMIFLYFHHRFCKAILSRNNLALWLSFLCHSLSKSIAWGYGVGAAQSAAVGRRIAGAVERGRTHAMHFLSG